MKSQVIKIKNLSESDRSAKAVRVKPYGTLLLIILAGIGMLFLKSFAAGIGLAMILLALFSILLLPDRILVQFTPNYLIMYNLPDSASVNLLYWDEIVNWQYEYHNDWDELVVFMTDGSSQSIDMFSKHSILKYMNLYAPGKEIKSVRVKEDRV